MIAGKFRSRVLQAPEGVATRPTSDRLRETLFNVLAPRIAGARFLDLYAGSGAVGIEALSRGAAEVVFVERGAAALAVLRTNLEKLGIRREARVRAGTVGAFLREFSGGKTPPKQSLDGAPGLDRGAGSFDVVFLDPPYEAAGEYETTLRTLSGRGILAEAGIVVAEHRRKDGFEERYGDLARTRVLQQGDAALSFYQRVSGLAS